MPTRKPDEPAEKKTVSVRLSPESAKRLRVVAAKEGLSMGAYLARLWEQSSAPRRKDGNT